jgi:hypothetical protein
MLFIAHEASQNITEAMTAIPRTSEAKVASGLARNEITHFWARLEA